jgi:hypothetical protein
VSLSDSIFDKLPKAWYAYCSFPAIFGAYHWITCFVDYFWDSSKVFCYILLHQFVMCCLVWLSVILMLTVFFLSLILICVILIISTIFSIYLSCVKQCLFVFLTQKTMFFFCEQLFQGYIVVRRFYQKNNIIIRR